MKRNPSPDVSLRSSKRNPPPTEEIKEKTLTTGKKLPPCPLYLGKHGQHAYAQAVQNLRDLKMEDGADARAVEAFAGAYEDYREAREVVDEQGFTYETFTQSGELKVMKRPEVEIMADAWKRMSSLLSQLCFTPAARNRGKKGDKSKVDEDPFAKFMSTN